MMEIPLISGELPEWLGCSNDDVLTGVSVMEEQLVRAQDVVLWEYSVPWRFSSCPYSCLNH